MTAVFLEANHDSATSIVHRARRKALGSIPGHQIIGLFGSQATEHDLRGAWINTPGYFDLLSGMGHGAANEFTGHNEGLVLGVSGGCTSAVKEAVVHLYSCDCAKELGLSLMGKGAKAFIGYRDRVLVANTDALAELFIREAVAIDKAVLERKSAEEIRRIADQEFTAAREQIRTHPDATLEDLAGIDSNHEALAGPWNNSNFGTL